MAVMKALNLTSLRLFPYLQAVHEPSVDSNIQSAQVLLNLDVYLNSGVLVFK